MKTLIELMRFYADHHTKTITKITHFIGIPIIILSVQIVLSWLHSPFEYFSHISMAWIAAILLLLYYASLDFQLALVSAIFLLPITLLANVLSQHKINLFSFILFCALFIFGWIIQFVGHYFEGKRPALFENIFQVFIAPIFLIAELCFMLGYRKDLQEKIEHPLK